MASPLTSSSSNRVRPGAGVVARRRRKARWWLGGLLAAVVAIAVVLLALEHGWWGDLVRTLEKVNTALALLLMALLPLAGFSIGVVYVVAGLKFGLLWGGVAIVGVTTVHLLGTHWIARSFLRGPIERFLQRRNYRLPEAPAGAERSLATMVALIPGPPYFLRNYALALSGIPLKTYFWPCLAVYTVRSYVTLALGDVSTDPSRAGFVWLAAIFAAKLAICAFLIRRIRREHRALREAASRATAAGPGPQPAARRA